LHAKSGSKKRRRRLVLGIWGLGRALYVIWNETVAEEGPEVFDFGDPVRSFIFDFFVLGGLVSEVDYCSKMGLGVN
jgi:hypothetical protein